MFITSVQFIVHSCNIVISCYNCPVSCARQSTIWMIMIRDTKFFELKLKNERKKVFTHRTESLAFGSWCFQPSNQTKCHIYPSCWKYILAVAAAVVWQGDEGEKKEAMWVRRLVGVINYFKFIIFTLKWFSMNKFHPESSFLVLPKPVTQRGFNISVSSMQGSCGRQVEKSSQKKTSSPTHLWCELWICESEKRFEMATYLMVKESNQTWQFANIHSQSSDWFMRHMIVFAYQFLRRSLASCLLRSFSVNLLRKLIFFPRPFLPFVLLFLINYWKSFATKSVSKASVIAISYQPSIVKIAYSNIYWWCHKLHKKKKLSVHENSFFSFLIFPFSFFSSMSAILQLFFFLAQLHFFFRIFLFFFSTALGRKEDKNKYLPVSWNNIDSACFHISSTFVSYMPLYFVQPLLLLLKNRLESRGWHKSLIFDQWRIKANWETF